MDGDICKISLFRKKFEAVVSLNAVRRLPTLSIKEFMNSFTTAVHLLEGRTQPLRPEFQQSYASRSQHESQGIQRTKN